MTKRFASLLWVALLVFAATSVLAGDEAAIIEAVDQAYVHGVHIEQDTAKIRAGFHDSFIMFVKSDEGVKHMTRDEWIDDQACESQAPLSVTADFSFRRMLSSSSNNPT